MLGQAGKVLKTDKEAGKNKNTNKGPRQENQQKKKHFGRKTAKIQTEIRQTMVTDSGGKSAYPGKEIGENQENRRERSGGNLA